MKGLPMPTKYLEKMIAYMERLPFWKLQLLILFMGTYNRVQRLAKRIGLVKNS